MEQTVTTCALNALLARLGHLETLSEEDVWLIDKVSEMMAGTGMPSSEMANIGNQIWTRLQHLSDTFWGVLGSIIPKTSSNHTKVCAFSLMSKRIAFEDDSLDVNIRSQIFFYMLKLKEQIVGENGGGRSPIGSMVREVLVKLVRLQWNGLFQDYFQQMDSNIKTISARNMAFQLQMMSEIIKEGYEDSMMSDLSTGNIIQFRGFIENKLRVMMKIVCYCLSDSPDRGMLTPFCFDLVFEMSRLVPAFELFNCDLVQTLLRLISGAQFQQGAFACLRELFGFKQGNEREEHCLKIAKRLQGVLQIFLKQDENGKEAVQAKAMRGVNNFDKQSASTNDSFYSRVTRQNGRRRFPSIKDLVKLFHLYLDRYVPLVIKFVNEKESQGECGQGVKFFCGQFVNFFQSKFWDWANFFRRCCREFDSILISRKKSEWDDQQEQFSLQFGVCIKLMVQLYLKLNLGFDQLLLDFISGILMYLTPLPRGLREIYVQSELVFDEDKVYFDEVKETSQQYQHLYRDIIKMLLSNKNLAKAYKDAVVNILEEIPQKLERLLQVKREKEGKILTASLTNIINRVSWSLVEAEESGLLHCAELDVNTIIGAIFSYLLNQNIPYNLCRAFAINLKYLLVVGPYHQYPEMLFESMSDDQTSKTRVQQFNLIVLSKIFLHSNFKIRSVYKGVKSRVFYEKFAGQIVRWANCLLEEYSSEEFLKIYPAMFRFISKKIQLSLDEEKLGTLSKRDFDASAKIDSEFLSLLVYEGTKKILEEIKTPAIDLPLINQVIRNFSCFEKINSYLIVWSEESDNTKNGFYWLLKRHLRQFSDILQKYFFVFKMISDNCLTCLQEDFRMQRINFFREQYHSIFIQYLRLYQIKWRRDVARSAGSFQKEKEDSLDKIRTLINQFSIDFQDQTEFKCITYFSVVFQWLKTLLVFSQDRFKEELQGLLNKIKSVMRQTRAAAIECLVSGKIMFWREVVQNFLFQLEEENFNEIYSIYEVIMQGTVTTGQIQLSIDLVQTLFKRLHACEKQSLAEKYLLNFFITTFKLIIQLQVKNEQLFKRLSQLLRLQMMVLLGSSTVFQGVRGSHQNVLFGYLLNHMYSCLDGGILSRFQQVHERMLRDFCEQQSESMFLTKLRDYKVQLLRWFNLCHRV